MDGYSSYSNCTVSRTFSRRGYLNFADSGFVTDQTFAVRFGRMSNRPKTAVINYWDSTQPNSYTQYGSNGHTINEYAFETYNFYLGNPNHMGRGVAVFL